MLNCKCGRKISQLKGKQMNIDHLIGVIFEKVRSANVAVRERKTHHKLIVVKYIYHCWCNLSLDFRFILRNNCTPLALAMNARINKTLSLVCLHRNLIRCRRRRRQSVWSRIFRSSMSMWIDVIFDYAHSKRISGTMCGCCCYCVFKVDQMLNSFAECRTCRCFVLL